MSSGRQASNGGQRLHVGWSPKITPRALDHTGILPALLDIGPAQRKNGPAARSLPTTFRGEVVACED
jgi:hypothetical protein